MEEVQGVRWILFIRAEVVEFGFCVRGGGGGGDGSALSRFSVARTCGRSGRWGVWALEEIGVVSRRGEWSLNEIAELSY